MHVLAGNEGSKKRMDWLARKGGIACNLVCTGATSECDIFVRYLHTLLTDRVMVFHSFAVTLSLCLDVEPDVKPAESSGCQSVINFSQSQLTLQYFARNARKVAAMFVSDVTA